MLFWARSQGSDFILVFRDNYVAKESSMTLIDFMDYVGLNFYPCSGNVPYGLLSHSQRNSAASVQISSNWIGSKVDEWTVLMISVIYKWHIMPPKITVFATDLQSKGESVDHNYLVHLVLV